MSETDKPVVLTYVGRRVLNKKLRHAFIKEGGDPDCYTIFPDAKASEFAGCLIGTVYELKHERLPRLWAAYAVRRVSEQQRMDWQAEDRADAEMWNQRTILPSPELEKAIAQIRCSRAAIRSPSKQRAFDVWLLNKISR